MAGPFGGSLDPDSCPPTTNVLAVMLPSDQSPRCYDGINEDPEELLSFGVLCGRFSSFLYSITGNKRMSGGPVTSFSSAAANFGPTTFAAAFA